MQTQPLVMISITPSHPNPTFGCDAHYIQEGEPNPFFGNHYTQPERRTQSMIMIVITHWKVNPIHGYDSHYPLEDEPKPWL